MAGKTIAMNKLREVIILFQRGASVKQTARELGIGRNTVRSYRRRLASREHNLEELLAMEGPELHSWFELPTQVQSESNRHSSFSQRVDMFRASLKQKGVTRYLLWSEYRQECPEGYGYSQFCYHLRLAAKAAQVTMVQHWQPGEALFVDFAGDTMDVTDPQTGQRQARQIFLATMGYSQLHFALAIERQTTECFVEALEKAVRYFGGSCQSLVCDNLKSAVTKADRYEPTLTQAVADWAAHHNMVVIPARVRRPQDKARVELGVKLFYQRVKAPLRSMKFFSDAELNEAITEKMVISNNTPMQRSGRSRQEVFDNDELPALGPLPEQRFEVKWRKSLMVQRNNHVYLSKDKTFYSAPYIYVGKRVEVIYSVSLVSIYADGRCVAVHKRRHAAGYSTSKEHLPTGHQSWYGRSTQSYLTWAAQTGAEEIIAVITRILTSRHYPQWAYRSCDGIKALYHRHGASVLSDACSLALELNQCTYHFISRHIKARTLGHWQDAESEHAMPAHDNIRGPEYYH